MAGRAFRTVLLLLLTALFISCLLGMIFPHEREWSVIRSLYPSDPMTEHRTSVSLVLARRSLNYRFYRVVFDWRYTVGFRPPKGYSTWHFDHSSIELQYPTLFEWLGFRWNNEDRPYWRRKLEIGIPLWLIMLISAASIAYLYRRQVLRTKYASGKCQNCGYDLRGSVSGICSECGLPCSAPFVPPGKSD